MYSCAVTTQHTQQQGGECCERRKTQASPEADALATRIFFWLLLFFAPRHTIPSTTAAGLGEGWHHTCVCGSQREGGMVTGWKEICAENQQRSVFHKRASCKGRLSGMTSLKTTAKIRIWNCPGDNNDSIYWKFTMYINETSLFCFFQSVADLKMAFKKSAWSRGANKCVKCRKFKQIPEKVSSLFLPDASLDTPLLFSWWSAKGSKERQTGQLETSATEGQESEVSRELDWWKVSVVTFRYLFIEKSTVSCERF